MELLVNVSPLERRSSLGGYLVGSKRFLAGSIRFLVTIVTAGGAAREAELRHSMGGWSCFQRLEEYVSFKKDEQLK